MLVPSWKLDLSAHLACFKTIVHALRLLFMLKPVGLLFHADSIEGVLLSLIIRTQIQEVLWINHEVVCCLMVVNRRFLEDTLVIHQTLQI